MRFVSALFFKNALCFCVIIFQDLLAEVDTAGAGESDESAEVLVKLT